jgi:hypothetical protein
VAELPAEANDPAQPEFVQLPDLTRATDDDIAELAAKIWEEFLSREPEWRRDEEPDA